MRARSAGRATRWGDDHASEVSYAGARQHYLRRQGRRHIAEADLGAFGKKKGGEAEQADQPEAGALDAEHVPSALDALKHHLAMHQEEDHVVASGSDHEEVVALRTRAFPLIELMETAVKNGDYVSWE